MKIIDLFEAEERSILSVMGKQKDPYPSNFSCSHKALISLDGAPSTVNGAFDCIDNKLTSLKGAPSTIRGYFQCNNNKLTSLDGAPRTVTNNFFCENNKLTSLAGAPSTIDDNFYCGRNKLTSLKGIHKIIKHIGGQAHFRGNPIESHVLGLLLIDGVTKVGLDNKDVQNTLNKHLAGDRDVFACQEELIEAGFPDFAKL